MFSLGTECTTLEYARRTKRGQNGEIACIVAQKMAYLLMSTPFTPRGSAVRARHRPRRKSATSSDFPFSASGTHVPSTAHAGGA